jgi:hypothetical protein
MLKEVGMNRFFVSLLVVLVIWGMAGIVTAATPERVSLIQLIATPEKFDGKLIHVVGVAIFSAEDSAIYINEMDSQQEIYKNGIAVDVKDRQTLKRKAQFNRHFVFVEGIFHADNKGRQDLFSGSIDNIERFELWRMKL